MSVKNYLNSLIDLSGKKVLVTGGTAGIGLSIVKHLLYKHADVIVLARNGAKFNKVKANLLESFPNGHLDFIRYDQNDDQSIVLAANEIIKNHLDFYALILNAGIIQATKNITKTDGYPTTIKTNFVGVALLIKLLIPYLKEGQRVVFQGSLGAGLYRGKATSLKDLKPRMFELYYLSKAGIEALFYYYANKKNANASFYLVEPGITKSDIIREFVPIVRFLGKIVLTIFSHSTDKAALTAMKALKPDTMKGTYIVPRGLFAYCGYPKIKAFPKKRQRQFLLDLLDEKYR